MDKYLEQLAHSKHRIKTVLCFLYMAAMFLFLSINYRLIADTEELKGIWHILILTALYGGILIIGIYVFYCHVLREHRKKKGNKKQGMARKVAAWFLRVAALILNAAYLFLMIEKINNPQLLEMKPFYIAVNILFITAFLMILLFLFQSMKKTLIAGNAFFLVFSLVFYFVYLFRGEPFQFIDVFSITTAAEVAGGYKWELTGYIVIFVICSALLLGFLTTLRDVKLSKRALFRNIGRAAVAAVLIGLYFIYMNTSWNASLGVMTDLYKPYKTYSEYGTSLGFLCVGKYMRLEAPDNYSADKVSEIIDSVDLSADTKSNPVTPVNIIAIMNESWADFRFLGDFQTDNPYMPYYDSLKENTIKGHALVSIRGGGTAKPEYEFLTGNSVKRYPGMVPFVSYFTDDQFSLATTLKAQGYTAEGMHPNKGSNWKRTTAYRMMGFDRFFDIEHFGEDAQRIRGHVSDMANYQAIIDRVEQKENPDDKYFMFNVTMQNHGGYRNTSYESTVHTEGYTDEAVNQYLSLVKDSDDALSYLIEYFKECDEPTLILMFGDHYPDLPDDFVSYITGEPYDEDNLELQQKYYSTPFFIWANYDIPEEENVYTSVNYLQSMMMEQTALNKTPYQIYLSKLREEMPALNHLAYMDKEGNFIPWDEGSADYLKLENEYEILQYNELSGGRKRQDDFFLPITD